MFPLWSVTEDGHCQGASRIEILSNLIPRLSPIFFRIFDISFPWSMVQGKSRLRVYLVDDFHLIPCLAMIMMILDIRSVILVSVYSINQVKLTICRCYISPKSTEWCVFFSLILWPYPTVHEMCGSGRHIISIRIRLYVAIRYNLR